MFYDDVMEAKSYIQLHINKAPEVGMILGSGLGQLSEQIEHPITLPYDSIPHFPISRVAGHEGNLIIGEMHGKSVMVMQGRFHYFEGYDMKEITFPVFVMKMLGVHDLIITNACGGINRTFQQGDLMLIDDFINGVSVNPLIGVNDERFGPRFPDMSEPYSSDLRNLAKTIADRLMIPYHSGVYTMWQGPYYETAAEIRMFERAGSDAIGMSTVPETIAANYLGMRVLGISCITNMATGICIEKHSHEEVLKVAETASSRLCAWIQNILQEM